MVGCDDLNSLLHHLLNIQYISLQKLDLVIIIKMKLQKLSNQDINIATECAKYAHLKYAKLKCREISCSAVIRYIPILNYSQ